MDTQDAADVNVRPEFEKFMKARRARPRRSLTQKLVVLVMLVLLAMFVHGAVTEPNVGRNIIGQYFFSKPILSGLVVTLELTALAMAIGIVLGTILAIMKSSKERVVRASASLYIWVFRGTPTLVQIIFWFNLGALIPKIGFGVPFGPMFLRSDTNSLVMPITAACLGLGLSQAAYTAEIVRGGIIGVDAGQIEAGHALGFRRRDVLRRIILPQALPIIIPPIGNEFIGMLKYSSLVSVIAVNELLTSAQIIYSRTFQTIPLLIVVSMWYLIVTSVFTLIQGVIERRLARSRARAWPGSRVQPADLLRAAKAGGGTA